MRFLKKRADGVGGAAFEAIVKCRNAVDGLFDMFDTFLCLADKFLRAVNLLLDVLYI